MNLEFVEIKTKKVFSLGTYSFKFLDDRDVFDESNKDIEYISKLIVWLGRKGCIDVANKSIKAILSHPALREDLKIKILSFISFLLESKEIKAWIR